MLLGTCWGTHWKQQKYKRSNTKPHTLLRKERFWAPCVHAYSHHWLRRIGTMNATYLYSLPFLALANDRGTNCNTITTLTMIVYLWLILISCGDPQSFLKIILWWAFMIGSSQKSLIKLWSVYQNRYNMLWSHFLGSYI